MNKRLLKTLAVSILSIASLAACGETSSTNKNTSTGDAKVTDNTTTSSTTDNQSTQHTLVHQYYGEDTEYANYGFAYTYYLNLYSDGQLDGYGYKFYSLDTTEAANNTNYQQWFTGKWGKAKDDDDEDCYKLVVSYVDGLKSMAGQAMSGKYNYIVYENGSKLTKIDGFNVPLGMSGRSVVLNYNENTFYTSGDDFISKTVYKFIEPTSYAALFEDVDNKERIYLNADNTGYYYGAATDPKTNTLGYYPKQEVTWAYAEGKLYVTIDSKREVTIDGKKGTLVWEETLQGDYKTNHNFACNDISSLTSKESGGDTDSGSTYETNTLYFTYNYMPSYHLSSTFHANQAIWTAALGSAVTSTYTNTESTDQLMVFTNDDTTSAATFTLAKNGTFTFSNTLAGNVITKTGTFTWANYKFTFTTTDGSVETTTTSIYTGK